MPLFKNDIELWDAFKKGDNKAFEQIYKQNFSALLRYGRTLVYDDDLVRDAIQDLFIDLHKYRSNLKPTDHILPYLFRSLKNSLGKRITLNNQTTELSEEQNIVSWEGSVEDVLMLTELSEIQSQIIQEALLSLPARQREAIHLKYFQELTNQEIADLMEINYQSVINFIQRGLSQLSENLALKNISGKIYSFIFPISIFFFKKKS
jgi:RNA polymerase sigma factor (sigma-70 family)